MLWIYVWRSEWLNFYSVGTCTHLNSFSSTSIPPSLNDFPPSLDPLIFCKSSISLLLSIFYFVLYFLYILEFSYAPMRYLGLFVLFHLTFWSQVKFIFVAEDWFVICTHHLLLPVSLFVCWNRISLCSPGIPQIGGISPGSASQELGLQASSTMPNPVPYFVLYLYIGFLF